VGFYAARGFTREQRELGERFAAGADAAGLLHVFGRWLPQLDPVNVATALNRIAKCPDGPAAAGSPGFLSVKELVLEQLRDECAP